MIDYLIGHVNQKDREKIKNILVEDIYRNNYKLAKFILYLDPNRLQLFSSQDEVRDQIMYTPLKALLIQGRGEKIYELKNLSFRGFQIGNPKKSNNSIVQLLIFGENNRQYNFLVSGKNISQEEIDFMLQSMQFMGPSDNG